MTVTGKRREDELLIWLYDSSPARMILPCRRPPGTRIAAADDGRGRIGRLPYALLMVTEEDIRRVALSLPGSVEKPYNRLPSFRVRSSLFLRVHELPDTFLVHCGNLEERDGLLDAEPGTFFISPHYSQYPGVLVRLSRIGLDEMTELVTEAWRLCAPKRMLAAYDAEPPATGF